MNLELIPKTSLRRSSPFKGHSVQLTHELRQIYNDAVLKQKPTERK
jgi:hypothetical protein